MNEQTGEYECQDVVAVKQEPLEGEDMLLKVDGMSNYGAGGTFYEECEEDRTGGKKLHFSLRVFDLIVLHFV
jgi:hypothetical protein